MTYNELKFMIEDYDLEKYSIPDFDTYYNGDSRVVNYYVGLDWFLGLLYVGVDLGIYFKKLTHKKPEFSLRWMGSERNFDFELYGRCIRSDIDKSVFVQIMKHYDLITIGAKYNLK